MESKMMTKEIFAKMLIQKFCEEEEIPREELKEFDILKSSSLAVAMEFLGLLKDKELKEYAFSRGGTIFSFYDKESKEVYMLSTRDLLEMLPAQ